MINLGLKNKQIQIKKVEHFSTLLLIPLKLFRFILVELFSHTPTRFENCSAATLPLNQLIHEYRYNLNTQINCFCRIQDFDRSLHLDS